MKRERGQVVPEARKEGLVVQHLSEEVLVYDQQRHKAHCLNETAALVWMRCDGKTSVSSIAEELSRRTGARVGEEVVWLAIDQLGKSRLLEARGVRGGATQGVSRREMMKRAGLAAAVAVPVVTSIMAPEAIQAATCLPSGSMCTSSAQCCAPSLCSGGVCV
jgi:Coenzyme PQQ synthesis protein D (PqqD)